MSVLIERRGLLQRLFVLVVSLWKGCRAFHASPMIGVAPWPQYPADSVGTGRRNYSSGSRRRKAPFQTWRHTINDLQPSEIITQFDEFGTTVARYSRQEQQRTNGSRDKSVGSRIERTTPTRDADAGSSATTFQPLKRTSNRTATSLEGGDLMCRVVALSDSKLPSSSEALPGRLLESPHMLRRLDDIYHAQAHEDTRLLQYMKRPDFQRQRSLADTPEGKYNVEEERDLVATVRTSLEDAGFQLLCRRDLDLCEALNAGYLLRLSILPDTSKVDPEIGKEFYPDLYRDDGAVIDKEALASRLLFDGHVLVFWRGYSQEVTKGRLLLPKFDYLQASFVQRLSGSVRRRLNVMDRYIAINSLVAYRKATACFLKYLRRTVDLISNAQMSKSLRKQIRSPYSYSAYKALNNGFLPSVSDVRQNASLRGNMFKLARYGGSEVKFVGSPNPMDALNPYIICEENSGSLCVSNDTNCQIERGCDVDRDIYELLNGDDLRCPYDENYAQEMPPMQLLERVSISNLVDVFSKEGRRKLINTLFSKSELVEPTYEEVVVVWRPLPPKDESLSRFTPPKIAYEIADMFDLKGLPEKREDPPPPKPERLEIRTFEKVPMANLPAVLPKTKLVFRPADAFVFDLVSIFSFLAIIGSVKFDSPKLDLIALISVSLWLIRTVLRYSNKLARYDLLVKRFLTSKISHRNAGALKYLATEAGSQRATRASLVHAWLTENFSSENEPLHRSEIITKGKDEINDMLENVFKDTPVDIDAALNDLEELELIERRDRDGRLLEVVRDESNIVRTLKRKWGSLFDGRGRNSLPRALSGKKSGSG